MTAAAEPLDRARPRLDAPDSIAAADARIAIVTNRLHSEASRRGYRPGLRQFLGWHRAQGGGPLGCALVQRYRVMLERRNLAPSTISQHLSIVRALAGECTESGLLDQPTAVAVGRVNGVPIPGVSVGKWLTREQLLSGPPSTLMGLGDRAILSLLIGCGLRRDELANPLSSAAAARGGLGHCRLSSARHDVCRPWRCRAGRGARRRLG